MPAYGDLNPAVAGLIQSRAPKVASGIAQEHAERSSALWAVLDAVQPGDVLWLSFAGEPRHVGFATDIGLLHAWAKPGRVVEHRLDAAWRRRIRSAWRPAVFADAPS